MAQCENLKEMKRLNFGDFFSALLEKQRERKDLLARELRKEKEKLRRMKDEVRQMQEAIAQKPSPHILPKVCSG